MRGARVSLGDGKDVGRCGGFGRVGAAAVVTVVVRGRAQVRVGGAALRGRRGEEIRSFDNSNVLERTETIPGKNIKLTIDFELQKNEQHDY